MVKLFSFLRRKPKEKKPSTIPLNSREENLLKNTFGKHDYLTYIDKKDKQRKIERIIKRINSIKDENYKKQQIKEFNNILNGKPYLIKEGNLLNENKNIQIYKDKISKHFRYDFQYIGKCLDAPLFYKKIKDKKYVYRIIDYDQYKQWHKLYKKGLFVEKISGFANRKEKSDIFEKLKIDKLSKNYVIVKSEVLGNSYYAKESNKVMDLSTLIKNKNRLKLTKFEKISISRQVLKTMVEIWKSDLYHGHTHLGNWVINFEKGIPQVRLIDFDRIKKLHKDSLNGNIYKLSIDYISTLYLVNMFNVSQFKISLNMLTKNLIENVRKNMSKLEKKDFFDFFNVSSRSNEYKDKYLTTYIKDSLSYKVLYGDIMPYSFRKKLYKLLKKDIKADKKVLKSLK